MALTAAEEAQTRTLIAQQAALLALAAEEPAIISNFGADDVSLSDLVAASSLGDADLLFVRQGVDDKSIAGSVIKAAGSQPDANETTKGVVELATSAETIAGTDNSRAIHPAGLATLTSSETRAGLVELATTVETMAGVDISRAAHPAAIYAATRQLNSIDYSIAAGALTLKLNPTALDFRSTALTSGDSVRVTNPTQLSTVISSGSTGGTISGQQSEIYILAINNAGTMELAWCNASGGVNLDETTLINTTTEGGAGAADSSTVIYSTTARTGIAFRVVGLFRSTQTTAGTWAQAPALVQGYGGQAFAALASIGRGQTWQSVSRVAGVTYYNTTGKPIVFKADGIGGASTWSISLTINGASVGTVCGGYVSGPNSGSSIIPTGASYSFTESGSPVSRNNFELR